jgi:hypothetical protein
VGKMNVWGRIFGIFLAVATGIACAQDIPSNAPACAITVPPADAGEDVPHDSAMKIYPRAKHIPSGYTGCQKVWLDLRGQWIPFSTRYYVNGHITVFLGPLIEGQSQVRCVAQAGTLKGRACPSLEEANRPAPSVPPGCIKELKAKAATPRCSCFE